MNQELDITAFNLIDEPWIPCIRRDGKKEELCLHEVLLKAHELRGLYGETPLIVASLYRFLLAMMYSVYGIPSTSSWSKHWKRKKNDKEKIDAYLKKWHERFYLFHHERPFFQWEDGAIRDKTIVDMLPELSSGYSGTLFDHHTESETAYFTPVQAVKALLLVQTSSVAGGNGLAPRDSSDAPWSRGIVFLAEGDTLFETLMLNFMPASQADILQKPSDVAFWESDNPYNPDRDIPLGISDYLTWPIRKIKLIPEEQNDRIIISDVFMGPGLKLNRDFKNPYYHYRITRKHLMQRFNEERVLWRDNASFFSFHKQDKFYPPRTLYWLANLVDDEIVEISRNYRYMALGMANSQAKIDFYNEEHLPLPISYLQNTENVDRLHVTLEAAENTRKKLYGALARMATLILSPTADDEEGRQPDNKDKQNLINHWAAERYYWASLETSFFHLLRDLPQSGETAIAQWDAVLQQSARSAFDQAASMAGNDANALRASVRARGQLEGGLKKLFS